MSWLFRFYLFLLALVPGVVHAQDPSTNPYTYVKMSLTVPWTLYFIFLAGVLIPFVLIIWLAWRNHMRGHRDEAIANESNGS